VNSVEDDAIIAAFNGAGPKELSRITGVKEQVAVTPTTLSKEKSSAPTIESTTDIDDYYEPFSYDESGYDPYAMYDLAPGELLEDYSQTTGETIGNNKNYVSLPGNKVKLRNGKTYLNNKLSTKLLLSLGYTLKESGEIIKNNKC
jgi:hypothetical protein